MDMRVVARRVEDRIVPVAKLPSQHGRQGSHRGFIRPTVLVMNRAIECQSPVVQRGSAMGMIVHRVDSNIVA